MKLSSFAASPTNFSLSSNKKNVSHISHDKLKFVGHLDAQQSSATGPTHPLDQTRKASRHGNPVRHLTLQLFLSYLFLSRGAESTRRPDICTDRESLAHDAADY